MYQILTVLLTQLVQEPADSEQMDFSQALHVHGYSSGHNDGHCSVRTMFELNLDKLLERVSDMNEQLACTAETGMLVRCNDSVCYMLSAQTRGHMLCTCRVYK